MKGVDKIELLGAKLFEGHQVQLKMSTIPEEPQSIIDFEGNCFQTPIKLMWGTIATEFLGPRYQEIKMRNLDRKGNNATQIESTWPDPRRPYRRTLFNLSASWALLHFSHNSPTRTIFSLLITIDSAEV